MSLRGSLSCQRMLATLVTIGVLVAPERSAADIILDDFTDQAKVESPAMKNVFVETPDVGELNAVRRIRIAAGGTDPVGSFDIGVTSQGRMTAQIEEIIRRDLLTPISAIQFSYVFDPTDVTEGGKNDAILFDFIDLVGDIQPTSLGALVWDNTGRGTFFHDFTPLVANDSPHTLVIPFDVFTFRGGSPGLPDPTSLREIRFDFFFFGHRGELNWSTQIERIRFGPAIVPEPDAAALMWAGIVSWGWYAFVWKGVWKDAYQNVVPASDAGGADRGSSHECPASDGSGVER